MSFINFDEISLCTDLIDYVEGINGLSSNSASPTDTWILTFKPDAPIYHRYKKIDDCFFKIFIDTSTYKLNPDYEYSEQLEGLSYERDVYSDVIYPLIQNNVCSNFVKYLSSANCTYDNLLNLLKSNGGSNNEKKLLRNISYMYENNKGRPSITSNLLGKPLSPSFCELAKKLDYWILCTKNMTNPKFLYNLLIDRSLTKQNLFELMFQIAISCHVMSLSHATHNDLHYKNIFVETSSSPNTYKYIIGENENDFDEYIITSKYNTYIYDFDRAYVQNMGHNPLLEGWACDDYYQCNKYIDNKDIVFVLSQIYEETASNDIKKIIIEIVKKNDRIQNKIIEQKLNSAINHSLPSEDYERYFNNTLEILKNIHVFYKVGITSEPEPIEKENIFLCLESFFDRNGRFMENTCRDAYDRIVSDISQKYFEPPSLSRELSGPYYSPLSSSKQKFKKDDIVYVDEIGRAYIKNYDYETNTYTIMAEDIDTEFDNIEEEYIRRLSSKKSSRSDGKTSVRKSSRKKKSVRKSSRSDGKSSVRKSSRKKKKSRSKRKKKL
jgi:hypothetical protein